LEPQTCSKSFVQNFNNDSYQLQLQCNRIWGTKINESRSLRLLDDGNCDGGDRKLVLPISFQLIFVLVNSSNEEFTWLLLLID